MLETSYLSKNCGKAETYHGKPVDESDETAIHTFFSECDLTNQENESNDITTATIEWFQSVGFGNVIKDGVYVFTKK